MDAPQGSIRIVVIKGSVRPGNYTSMALDLVADEFSKFPEVELHVVDPAGMGLTPPGAEGGEKEAEALRQLVEGATGVVLSTPEYHGSFSSVVKLVIENLDFPSVLGGKPIALLGVAAG
jgi:chromate reductase, NAD(P)H dehydrogenase (quinone)